MRRIDSEPIEPTPETDPYKYLTGLLGGERAREINNNSTHIGLLMTDTPVGAPAVIGIHVFDANGATDESFFLTENNYLAAMASKTPSATGVTNEDIFGLEHYTFGFGDTLKSRFSMGSENRERVSDVFTTEEVSNDPYEHRICVKVAKFVEKCVKESKF